MIDWQELASRANDREKKFCKHCKWAMRFGETFECAHTLARDDAGNIQSYNGKSWVGYQRTMKGECGPEGLLFESTASIREWL